MNKSSLILVFLLLFSCEDRIEYTSKISCLINGVEEYEYFTKEGGSSSFIHHYDKAGKLVAFGYILSAGRIYIRATDSTFNKNQFSGDELELYYSTYPTDKSYIYKDGALGILDHKKIDSNNGIISAYFNAILINEFDPTDVLKIDNGKLEIVVNYGSTRP